jgi:hypothetical protein
MPGLTTPNCGCPADDPCCKGPYVPNNADCIEEQLNTAWAWDSTDLANKLVQAIKYGKDTLDIIYRLQDIQLITGHLLQAFQQRVIDTLRLGTDPGQAAYWERFQLKCLGDYAQRRFGIDPVALMVIAGFYDPSMPMPCGVLDLPVPYDVPCGSPVPVLPAPPVPCDLSYAFTVKDTVDTIDRITLEEAGPSVEDSYLVATDSGAGYWSVGTIVTWNGTDWGVTIPPAGSVIKTLSGAPWYVWSLGVVGPLWPALEMDLVAPGTYNLVSTMPQGLPFTDRSFTLLANTPTGPLIVHSGPEADLLDGIPILLDGDTVTSVNVRYVDATGCSWPAPATVVIPPFGTCGTPAWSVKVVPYCSNGFFEIEVSTGNLGGFLLAGVRTVHNGLTELTPLAGNSLVAVGPFDTGEIVQLFLAHQSDPDCDIDLGTFTFGDCSCVPSLAAVPVDASFMASAVPGRTYLITGDNASTGNEWALHIGGTVIGGTSSYVPVPLGGRILRLLPDGTPALPQDILVWTGPSTGAGPLFPKVIATTGDLGGVLTSQAPAVNLLMGRSVRVDGLFTTGWAQVWPPPPYSLQGESLLADGPSFNYTEEPTAVQATFVVGGCSYGPFPGLLSHQNYAHQVGGSHAHSHG